MVNKFSYWSIGDSITRSTKEIIAGWGGGGVGRRWGGYKDDRCWQGV